MKIVRLSNGNNETYGFVKGDKVATKDEIIYLTGVPLPHSVKDFLFDGWYDEIKNKIKDKKAVHSSRGGGFFLDKYKAMESNGNMDEYSNTHPILRTHPETGKKILFVNWTYTKEIVGMDKKESDEILNYLFEHQARLDLTCRFKWTENAIAIWDNRSVQHYAIADFYPNKGLGFERIMDRIAIEGDHPQ